MKSNFFLIAPFALFSTACAFSCDPNRFLFDVRDDPIWPASPDPPTTKYMEATMMGRCDAPYGNFHADLALYSYTKEHYCQLYLANPILNYLSPQDGTLLEGSQHVYDNAGNGFDGNIDEYSWNDQNFILDINLLVMTCATWSFTDAAGQNPTPPHTTCEISDGPQC